MQARRFNVSEETFAERLKRLRKGAGFSQEELAFRVGVHLNTVSRWENGIDLPKTLKFKKLAKILHISEEELLHGVSKNSTWVLHVEIGDNKEDYIDMRKGIQPQSVIITSTEGGWLKLGGDYALWTDESLFRKVVADLKKLRSSVIQNGKALGGIKE